MITFGMLNTAQRDQAIDLKINCSCLRFNKINGRNHLCIEVEKPPYAYNPDFQAS